MKHYRYAFILIGLLGVPMILFAWELRGSLSIPSFILSVLTLSYFGILWDMWATRHGRKGKIWIWKFNLSTTTGKLILAQPIEEYAFAFMVISFIIILWEFLKKLFFEPSQDLLIIGIIGLAWIYWMVLIVYGIQSKEKHHRSI